MLIYLMKERKALSTKYIIMKAAINNVNNFNK